MPFAESALGAPSVNLKLNSLPMAGTKLTVEYDSNTPDTIKSLSMFFGPHSYGGVAYRGEVTYIGAGGGAIKYVARARHKLAKLKATVLGVHVGKPKCELEVSHDLNAGRAVSATLQSSKILALEYMDSLTDPVGTWTVQMAMPLGAGALEALTQPQITAKRSWSF